MSIVILFTDLRAYPSKLEKHVAEWAPDMTARQILQSHLGSDLVNGIDQDLKENNQELKVSWYNNYSGDISEIGGIGNIDWIVPDGMVITVSYENEHTTRQQIDDSIAWTMKQEID